MFMYAVKCILAMSVIALVPCLLVVAFEMWLSRRYARDLAKRRHPCNYKPTYPTSNVTIL